MIPAAFDYARADSVDEAIELLGSHEDAKILAGGHSLLPLMRLRLARPAMLIDIGRVADLRTSARTATRRDRRADAPPRRREQRAAADLVPDRGVHRGEIGDPQVRHMGTIGGSVAHGGPRLRHADGAVALGAEFVVRGAGRRRARSRPADSSRAVHSRSSRRTRC